MNICVVGAGAVGGYFGGRLAAAGLPVTFLCRGRVREAIEKKGLRIDSISGNVQIRPACCEIPDASAKADLIFWAVKSYHNEEAIRAARPWVGAETSILSLQNGLDAAEDLGTAFGAEKIVGGFASIAAEAVEPGVIRHTALGRITLGELDGRKSQRLKKIAALFEKSGVPHKISKNVRRDLWGKLVWNAAFNPLSVILRAGVEEMLKNLASLSILKRAMEEAMAAAKAEGYDLSPKLMESCLDDREQSGEFRTSMLQDFSRGRPMEVDAISGAVVRRARARGVPVPVNEFFYDALRYLDSKAAG